MDTKLKGCLYGSVAAMTYGMNPLFAVNLYKGGMNPDSVLLFRTFPSGVPCTSV